LMKDGIVRAVNGLEEWTRVKTIRFLSRQDAKPLRKKI
jgi:hypothetical protein